MSYRELMEYQHKQTVNLQEMLTRLVNSYRLLVGAANELNGIALSDRRQVKDALKRAQEVGALIDDVNDALKRSQCRYLDYCVMYSQEIKNYINPQNICEEIKCALCTDI